MLLFMTRFEGIIISVFKGAGKYLGQSNINKTNTKYKIKKIVQAYVKKIFKFQIPSNLAIATLYSARVISYDAVSCFDLQGITYRFVLSSSYLLVFLHIIVIS